MVHSKAFVETNDIDSSSIIEAFAIVRKDAKIGSNAIIHQNVVIESGVIIENGVEIFPGAYIGKEPKGAGALAREPIFNRKVFIGENCSIGPNVVIYYDVQIGPDTLIGDGASIREKCSIGTNCLISRYVTINYNVKIGNRTKIMDLSHITGNSIIGNDVFISIHVSTVNDNALGQFGYKEDEIVGPRIKDKAMIGAGAILFPKIVIGESAIVGAGSLVTKDVEPRTLVMGAPAKYIRNI